MTSTKYIGMDVHKKSISIAVMNSVGKVVMECGAPFYNVLVRHLASPGLFNPRRVAHSENQARRDETQFESNPGVRQTPPLRQDQYQRPQ